MELAGISVIVEEETGMLGLLGVIGGVGKLMVLKTREDSVEEIVEVIIILHSWVTEIIRLLFLRFVDQTNVRTGVSEDGGILVMGGGLEVAV